MSYLKNRNKTIRNSNTTSEYLRQNSRVKIDQNILNYLSQVNDKGKLKKISSLNEAKDGKISANTYNGLNDNIHIDFERKSKARRSLLYLLNKMSGGTFCPQIIDYFKEIRELKKQEELLKEVKEEDINEDEPPIIINSTKGEKNNYIKNNNSILSNFKNQILNGQNKSNYPNYNFTKRNEKDNNINEEKSLISKHYARDFELKDLEKFIDSDEIAKMNGNKFNFNKEAQAKKKFLEEITIDEDDRYYQKKARRNEKKKFKENEIFEVEVNVEDNNIKRKEDPKVPSLNLNKLKLNRMNTISGGFMKENNLASNKNNNINLNNYNATSEIIEEKGEKSSFKPNKLGKNNI